MESFLSKTNETLTVIVREYLTRVTKEIQTHDLIGNLKHDHLGHTFQ